MKEYFEPIFDAYVERYKSILSTALFYPAKNSTGFPERNLSVNFAFAYQKLHPEAICWFEFQFGDNNKLHYDGLIIDPKECCVLVVESKRLKGEKKIREIKADILRIHEARAVLADDRIDKEMLPNYKIYGVVLADVWTISHGKTSASKLAYKDSFQDQSFAEQYLKDDEDNRAEMFLSNGDAYYNSCYIPVRDADGYYLTYFVWNVE